MWYRMRAKILPLIVIEESDYGQPWGAIGVALNWGTWLAFLAEVVMMLAVVPDRKRWVRENPIRENADGQAALAGGAASPSYSPAAPATRPVVPRAGLRPCRLPAASPS